MTSAPSNPIAAPDDLEAARRLCFRLLRESRQFARASTWVRAVVILEPSGSRVRHRAAFGAELHADGLVAAAHEATSRRVPPGSVLVYCLRDDEESAFAGFIVLDLLGGPR
jgi:hypothetical protein